MDENQRKYLHALNIVLGASPERLMKILSTFPFSQDAFNISQIELEKLNFQKETIDAFLKRKERIEVEKEWQRLKKEDIRLVVKEDEEYPEVLREIAKPPILLYIKGKLLPGEKYLACVGTRWPSDYGKMVTPEIVGDLAETDFTIASGMARGIDTLAHKTALSHEKRTVAVVGNGLDIIFPPENQKLAKEIEEEGAIISEFPLETPPLKYNFPLRNRIIAGMSLGTLVIEGSEKSGALITANLALEEGREVFAIPGPIYSRMSKGPNNLIKQGAQPVTQVSDILTVFNLEAVTKEKEIKGETKEENLIIEVLKKEPAQVENLIKETGLDISKINSSLILMEIKGKIKRSGNQYFINC
ncbi:MAG: DNA-protecting protein DprA [Parcubacteria group bacterium CG_4_9_14_0_2_um_filter_35_11]|nr:MAG: DNA-protecting protein DprA [Parcubacteria group bacterium CG07_land_8_20_14_0_80_35_11]PJC47359.1 MAG: DNA-protecting protein DprA [Parcubacteria group bacterium CG_4_9_14_0_2_um_filter_35_11]